MQYIVFVPCSVGVSALHRRACLGLGTLWSSIAIVVWTDDRLVVTPALDAHMFVFTAWEVAPIVIPQTAWLR